MTAPKPGQGIHHAAYSELVAPVFTPYADGKGNLDVGMRPINNDEIFHYDCFYPYYMMMKHMLFKKYVLELLNMFYLFYIYFSQFL